MDHASTICVTVSADLLSHLRQVAEEQHVPISWLVTGLICDTIATCNERVAVTRISRDRALASIRPSPAWN
jgi:hypothetical protein